MKQNMQLYYQHNYNQKMQCDINNKFHNDNCYEEI